MGCKEGRQQGQASAVAGVGAALHRLLPVDAVGCSCGMRDPHFGVGAVLAITPCCCGVPVSVPIDALVMIVATGVSVVNDLARLV